MEKKFTNILTFWICIVLVLQASSSGAQEMSWAVAGRVFEKGTRKPIEGALVSVQELSTVAATTDEKGSFVLTISQLGKYTVMVSFPGENKIESKIINLETGTAPPDLAFYLTPPVTLEEVVVSAERNPNRVSKTVIKGEELRQVAGSSGDPLRALQSLPGVAVTSGGAPAIRGSGPGDNYYYADSIPVGKLFHLGLVSVFNGDLIDNFNIYSAAFAPYYDNVTGAILDITLRNPRTDRLGGKVNVSLTTADFLVEGPTSPDQSFYFAARRSYFDLFIRSIETKGAVIQVPNYSDYQGKYIWNLNPDNRLTAHINGATDNLKAYISSDADIAKTQPDLVGALSLLDSTATQAVVLDTRMTSSINNKLVVGHLMRLVDNSAGTVNAVRIITNNNFVREQVVLPVHDNHELTLATNVANVIIDLELNAKNTNCTQFNTGCDLSGAPSVQLKDSFTTNFWDVAAQDRWHIQPSVTLIGGLRHSTDNFLHQSYAEPRVGMEWQSTEQTLWSAGWGKHNQQPTGQQIVPKFGNPNLTHILADHSVVGVSHKVDFDWSWKAEIYYKKFSDLVVGVPDPAVNYVNGASGSAYGSELLIKKEATERLSGWLALTLAKSERRNDLTGETFRFAYDQPINATLITNYKMSDEWSFGSKWTFTSGLPYTPILGSSGTYSSTDLRPKPDYAPINSGTLPDKHRLDIRFDRHLVYDTWKLNVYFEINNVYRRKNISGYDYGPNYDKKDPVEELIIPISFGVQGEF